MGNKDGYTGNWMFAIYGKSGLANISDVQVDGARQGEVHRPEVLRVLHRDRQAQSNGCFNDDISSLDLNQGWQLFPQKKAAMAWTTDGNALTWAKTLGADNIGVGAPPKLGTRRAREHLRHDAVLDGVHHLMVQAQAGRRGLPGLAA